MARRLKKKTKYILIGAAAIVLVLCGAAAGIGLREYNYRFKTAVLKNGNLKVKTGTSFYDLVARLEKEGFIKSSKKMETYAIHYERDSVRAGNYDLEAGSSYRTLLNTFYLGRETPVRMTFNNIRSMERLAGAVSRYTEADSTAFLRLLRRDSVITSNGFTKPTFMAMFIPNTYEIYWTMTPVEFVERMKKEYDRFWTSSRKSKAENIGLTPEEVSTLASIVYEESKIKDEMPTIAGVYLNRLKKKIPLQADPTVKFAMGDPTIRRVLTRYLSVDSPYNTYKYAGLPPGPICMPPIVAIDAVLDAEEHDYLYFCAAADFSGRHKFAKSLTEHNRNAAEYSKALNKARIMR